VEGGHDPINDRAGHTILGSYWVVERGGGGAQYGRKVCGGSEGVGTARPERQTMCNMVYCAKAPWVKG